MKITLGKLRRIIREVATSATSRSSLNESYTRITAEEINAWKSGDWGYVSEAGPPPAMLGGRRLKEPAPGDIEGLATFIERNADFIGAAQEMGVDLNTPEMRQYIGDALAGKYSSEDIDAALAML